MAEVADIAQEGRTALLEKDYTKLAALMNSNFDLRRFEISAFDSC
jgi:glucuronokinase